MCTRSLLFGSLNYNCAKHSRTLVIIATLTISCKWVHHLPDHKSLCEWRSRQNHHQVQWLNYNELFWNILFYGSDPTTYLFKGNLFCLFSILQSALIYVREGISLGSHCMRLTEEYCIQQKTIVNYYYFLPAYLVHFGFPHVQQAMKSIHYDKVSKQIRLNIIVRWVTQYWHPIEKEA